MTLEIIPKPDFISYEDITDLLHLAFTEHAQKGLHFSACDQSSKITRQRAKNGVCLVALLDGKLVGTGLVKILQYHGKTVGHFGQLGILPEMKRYGIGFKILEMQIDICRQKGVDTIYSNTSEKAKSAVKLHLKVGMKKVGLLSLENTNYYSIKFRYALNSRKYTDIEAKVRFGLSYCFCKSLWRENGSLRPIGKFLKRMKRLCKR